jgi:uncharacterized protein with PQ loop repeat
MTNTQTIESILGYIAGSLILISNQFQIIKFIKTKNVKGFSFTYLLLYLILSILYSIAGILGNITYIYIPNIICSVQQLVLLLLYLYFKNHKNNITEDENLLI